MAARLLAFLIAMILHWLPEISGLTTGGLTGRDLKNGSLVIGCSHDSGHLCYVAKVDNLSDEVTVLMRIVDLGSLVASNTNLTYVEVIFTPTDDERGKFIVAVFDNKTRKEGWYHIPPKASGPTIGPGSSTGPTIGPGSSTEPTIGPGSSTEPTIGPGSSTGPTIGPGSSTQPTQKSTDYDTVPILASTVAAALVLLTAVRIAVVIIGTVLAIKRYKGQRSSTHAKVKKGDVPLDTV